MVGLIVIWVNLSMFCSFAVGGMEGSVQRDMVAPARFPWAEDSGPASHSPWRGIQCGFIACGPHHHTPLPGVLGVSGHCPRGDGSAGPCCNMHRGKEIKNLQLPDTLEIALCSSHRALWKAGDSCTDFLILRGEKKLESLWALLHNLFTQTFSSACFHVGIAEGLHLTYMQGPPRLHPCSVMHFF